MDKYCADIWQIRHILHIANIMHIVHIVHSVYIVHIGLTWVQLGSVGFSWDHFESFWS